MLKKGSYSEQIFVHAEESTIFHNIYLKLVKNMDESHRVQNETEGLKRVLSQMGPKALYYSAESIYSIKEFDCMLYAPYLSKYPKHLSGE